MKKYRILYKPYFDSNVYRVTYVEALCESDAITTFFDNIGGLFLGCEFVEWI